VTEVVLLLKAAAHSDRLRILQVLRDSRVDGRAELPITDIAQRSELSRFSASRHLGLLTEAQLVNRATEGSRRLHSLSVEAFEAIEGWVIAFTSIDEA
jgi:DNA-binding transcriptional ArsR family regulator